MRKTPDIAESDISCGMFNLHSDPKICTVLNYMIGACAALMLFGLLYLFIGMANRAAQRKVNREFVEEQKDVAPVTVADFYEVRVDEAAQPDTRAAPPPAQPDTRAAPPPAPRIEEI